MICVKCGKPIPEDAVFCPYCGRKQIPERRKRTRGNGTGTVYKDGDQGSWIAEVTLGYYIRDGKVRRKSRRKYGFKTKKEAINYLPKLQEGRQERKNVNFSTLFQHFVEKGKNLSKSKQTAYRIAWKKVESAIGYRYIDDVTVPELQELTDTAGSSYYTKRDIKSLLSHCYQIAIRDDYTDKNRAQYIQIGSPDTKEREVLTDQEIRTLWDDYAREPAAITAQMLLMLYTGIRPGELLTIRKENVHLTDQYMTGGIKTAKGKKRKIILPDKIVPVLHWMIDREPGELIAGYKKSTYFYDEWIAKRKELGIRDCITPYCCRHTYVTRLTALKVSPAMLQELAGHEDYDTTLEYTHLSVSDRLKEVNRLA